MKPRLRSEVIHPSSLELVWAQTKNPWQVLLTAGGTCQPLLSVWPVPLLGFPGCPFPWNQTLDTFPGPGS